MDPLANYILPIGGMDLGIHEYNFIVDDYFLSHFEDSPYEKANVEVLVYADRRQNLVVLTIELRGDVACVCDRCTADIRLPIDSSHQVFLKAKENTESTSDDVIYIDINQVKFSVATLLYDLFCLAIPIKKIYDCESDKVLPCNTDILDRLDQRFEDKNDDGPSIWDELRNKINN